MNGARWGWSSALLGAGLVLGFGTALPLGAGAAEPEAKAAPELPRLLKGAELWLQLRRGQADQVVGLIWRGRIHRLGRAMVDPFPARWRFGTSAAEGSEDAGAVGRAMSTSAQVARMTAPLSTAPLGRPAILREGEASAREPPLLGQASTSRS